MEGNEKQQSPSSESSSGSITEVEPQKSQPDSGASSLINRESSKQKEHSVEKPKGAAIDEYNDQDERQAYSKSGQPSEQPNSQQAHVDPAYFALNPWYGQSSDRGPRFSTAWPFPRTVRPGMLNSLSPEMLRELRLQEEQEEDESMEGNEPDLEKGSDDRKPNKQRGRSDQHTKPIRNQKDQPRRQRTATEEDDFPPDIRRQEQRPVPRVMPEDEADQTKDVPPDVRNPSMRPTTGVMPGDRREGKAHNLTSRTKSKDTSDTSRTREGQGTVDRIREQASEPGHTEPENSQAPSARELRNPWARIRARTPEPLAEFVATTISVYIGLAGSLSKTTSNGEYGTFMTQAFSWGFGVMFGIYVAGGVSGAHLNPAVSITLSLFRGFPWRRCGVYVCAQMLGGLVAGAIAFSVYHDAIYNFDPTLNPSISGVALFTVPQPFISISSAFFNEFVSGVVLMTVLLALGDDTNAPPGAGMNAFILGLLVTTLIFTNSYQTGLSLNPARDFGPRLVALWMGYPRTIFTGYSLWWLWGAWIAPVCGCIVGCTVYDTMVFSGGESPLNYRWPSRKDFVQQIKGKGKRVHDHVNAQARIKQ